MSGAPRVLFFGTPVFAAEVLEYLHGAGIPIVGVVSKPDKAVGRSATPVKTAVAATAERLSLPLLQPAKASAPDQRDAIAAFGADLFVVVAYGEIIREHLLQMPPLGCINLHASLLPGYRGAAPIQRCLIDGVTESGVTIIHMVREMDAGDIIAQASLPVTDAMTYGELSDALCKLGKRLLCDTIRAIGRGAAARTPQDSALVTFAPKIELEECLLSWDMPARQLHNLIRGVNPEPGAWCWVAIRGERRRLRIMRAHTLAGHHEAAPATLLQYGKGGIVVACGVGALCLEELQLEGKKLMTAAQLACGLPVEQIRFL